MQASVISQGSGSGVHSKQPAFLNEAELELTSPGFFCLSITPAPEEEVN